MFNDRDLGVLGAGAVLSVLCLLLPLPFNWKVVVGALVLVGFMVIALLRLGPDRIPPEEWLRRRIRYRLQARRYTYQQAHYRPPAAAPRDRKTGFLSELRITIRLQWNQLLFGFRNLAAKPDLRNDSIENTQSESVHPLVLDFEEVGLYPLTTALLGVVGVYFLAWLVTSGGTELARLIGGMLS